MDNLSLYIHIPYCKRKCNYCNFHFSTNFATKKKVISAILKEIETRRYEIPYDKVESIYLGGGTPSLLDVEELQQILNIIYRSFRVDSDAEITVEVNPDDLTMDKAKSYIEIGINRLSIGVQSFFDKHLEWMNRVHSAKESQVSIQIAQDVGFNNISCDLIFGIPHCTHQQWTYNVQQLFRLGVPHISCYALTVEEKTQLHYDLKKSRIDPLSDLHTIEQMEILLDLMEFNHYEAYEISNYCKPGSRALHNSKYWSGLPYLGFGPSAHSFQIDTRRWNISNNHLYSNLVLNSEQYFETETLTLPNKFNEYLMINIRRVEGFSLSYVINNFPTYYKKLIQNIEIHLQKSNLVLEGRQVKLTRQGKFICDAILADLFA